MGSVAVNRIIVILSFVGIFIAGVLSLSHALNFVLPCGFDSTGCDVIAQHPSSKLGPIPIAYIGVLGYIVILALAIVRLVSPTANQAKLNKLGFLTSAFGAAVSLGYTIYALTVIKATCTWCIASAITMGLLFVVHSFLFQSKSPQDRKPVQLDWIIIGLFGVLAAGAIAFEAVQFNKEKIKPIQVSLDALGEDPIKALVPDDTNWIGAKDPVVTIVEFADYMCPACKNYFAGVKAQTVEKYPDKIKFVFRHFPLMSEHKQAFAAAVYAEYAATQDKFWEFTTAMYAIPDKVTDTEQLDQVLRNINLDPAEAKKILEDHKSKPFTRAYRDYKLSNRLGLLETPTYILIVKGQPIKAMRPAQLITTIDSKEIQELLK